MVSRVQARLHARAVVHRPGPDVPQTGRGELLVPRLPLAARPDADGPDLERGRLQLGLPAGRRADAAAARPRDHLPPRRHAHLRLAAAGERRARDRPAGQAPGARAAAVPAELRRDLGPDARGGQRELGLLQRPGPIGALPGRPAREPHPGAPVPQAGLRDPLPGHVPAAGELRRLLRHVHRARPRPGPDRQVPAGLRHQDHGDRPGAVEADHRGPRGRPGVRLRRERGRRDPGGAGRLRRPGRPVADQVRRLPAGLRLAHGGLLRHRAAELERGPDPGPRHDQDVPAEGHRARLRGGPGGGRRRSRGGRRRGQVHPHPGGAEALRQRPRLLPGGELPVVAGRPQLLHRPAHLAADAVGVPGHRGPGRRRPPGRHALPVLGGDHGRLLRPEVLRRVHQPGRAAQAVLRLLAAAPPHAAQGGRHHPGVGERPDPDRDLRPERPLPARRGGGPLRRRGQDADRRAGLQGHRPRHRPRPAQRRRTAPAQPRRGAGLRVHLAELDPGLRQDRRLRLRRRRHASPSPSTPTVGTATGPAWTRSSTQRWAGSPRTRSPPTSRPPRKRSARNSPPRRWTRTWPG